jgi:hypothetical protein
VWLPVTPTRDLVIEISVDELAVLETTLPHSFAIPPGEGWLREITYTAEGDPAGSELRAHFGGGTLRLDAFGHEPDTVVTGTLEASLYFDEQ